MRSYDFAVRYVPEWGMEALHLDYEWTGAVVTGADGEELFEMRRLGGYPDE